MAGIRRCGCVTPPEELIQAAIQPKACIVRRAGIAALARGEKLPVPGARGQPYFKVNVRIARRPAEALDATKIRKVREDLASGGGQGARRHFGGGGHGRASLESKPSQACAGRSVPLLLLVRIGGYSPQQQGKRTKDEVAKRSARGQCGSYVRTAGDSAHDQPPFS